MANNLNAIWGLCGKTVNPKPAISCHHAIIYKLWTGTISWLPKIVIPHVFCSWLFHIWAPRQKNSCPEPGGRMWIGRQKEHDCNSNSKLHHIFLSINVHHFWTHQMQLALYTIYQNQAIGETLKLYIANDQYYHSSSAYMSGGRNQKGERPFPNTSVVPMTCEDKGSYNQDLWNFMKLFAPNFQQWIFPFCQTNDGQGNNFCLSKYSPLRVYVHFKQRYSKAGILTSLKAHTSLLSLTLKFTKPKPSKTLSQSLPLPTTSADHSEVRKQLNSGDLKAGAGNGQAGFLVFPGILWLSKYSKSKT